MWCHIRATGPRKKTNKNSIVAVSGSVGGEVDIGDCGAYLRLGLHVAGVRHRRRLIRPLRLLPPSGRVSCGTIGSDNIGRETCS